MLQRYNARFYPQLPSRCVPMCAREHKITKAESAIEIKAEIVLLILHMFVYSCGVDCARRCLSGKGVRVVSVWKVIAGEFYCYNRCWELRPTAVDDCARGIIAFCQPGITPVFLVVLQQHYLHNGHGHGEEFSRSDDRSRPGATGLVCRHLHKHVQSVSACLVWDFTITA